ncbi:probable inactive receptor kinase RLK902 [Macadamia integrifolia]|uniref:probable inactive receptor kinase RLK902 n=1 Tax=Macadamia integrifolia TaxID=60698 RepID=UPI001C4FF8C5|nr:probable inactive receptor kinase RLK902 [Macadamia integrifolia]
MGWRHYLVLLCSLVSLSVGKPGLALEKAALLPFKAAVGRYISWNQSANPCTWQGIECENNNSIITIRLPGYFLSGEIPMGIFGNLTHLRTLSLRINSLSAQLPLDLASCTELCNLYLQRKQFSSEIPEFLFGLYNLVRPNLANNNFSGEISSEFNNLTRLGTLYLEYNQLTGSIPDLPKLVSLYQFNVSYNHLNCSIPSSLSTKNASSFLRNSLCGGPLLACPGGASPPTSSFDGGGNGKKKLSRRAIAVWRSKLQMVEANDVVYIRPNWGGICLD